MYATSIQCAISFNDFEVTKKDCLVPSKSLFYVCNIYSWLYPIITITSMQNLSFIERLKIYLLAENIGRMKC